MKCIKCILILALAVQLTSLWSQNSITGRVVDAGQEGIAYANVLLFNANDTVNLQLGTITDSLGYFVIDQVQTGQYRLVISLIGYASRSISVEIETNMSLALGDLTLSEMSTILEAVVVTAQKKLIQKTASGFVVNPGATLSAQGGSAVEILSQVPTVFVDGEGAVSLRGKTPLILINGRNSKLTNLSAIPASSIEHIEIITNPSAAYDAESESGILNIVLKKGINHGLNGALAIGTGYGAYGRLNSSAIVNRKSGPWNLGLAYDNRLGKRTRNVTGDRINFNLPELHYLTQRRHDDRQLADHNLRANLDFERNQNIFTLETVYALENETNLESLVSTFETQDRAFVSKNRRFSEEIRRGQVAEMAAGYQRRFTASDDLFSFHVSTSLSIEEENTPITTQPLASDLTPLGPVYLQRTHFGEDSRVSQVRMDYRCALGVGLLESGYKSIWRQFDNEFVQENQENSQFYIVPERTGDLDFREQIHAVYTQFKHERSNNAEAKWAYDAGIRLEYTNNHGQAESLNTDFSNRYTNLFSSLGVRYFPAPQQILQFTYGKRINRPSLGQLNPFTDITDSLTQRSGNPLLKPEIIDALELSFTREADAQSLTVKAFYRQGRRTILPYTALQSNGVLLTRLENVGQTQTFGLESIFTFRATAWWDGHLSTSLFNQDIKADEIGTQVTNHVLSWHAKWLNDLSLWKNGKLQVSAVYNSPTATIQGTRVAVYNLDLAMQQKLSGDKARLGLIITDVFNTQKNGFTWSTPEFDFRRVFKVDTRAITMTFAYTFGTKFKEKLMDSKFSNE